jgi:hypothetical protein
MAIGTSDDFAATGELTAVHAQQVDCLRTVRFAICMNLATRIVQWLERPASDFIYRAQW